MSKISEQLSFHFDTTAAYSAQKKGAASSLPKHQSAPLTNPIKSIDVDTSNAGDVALLLLRIQNGRVPNLYVSFDGMEPVLFDDIVINLNDKADLKKFVIGLNGPSIDENGCTLFLGRPHIFILNKINSSNAHRNQSDMTTSAKTECRPAHYDPNIGIGLAAQIADAFVSQRMIGSANACAILSADNVVIKLRDSMDRSNHRIYDLKVQAVQGQIVETPIPICDYLYRPTTPANALQRLVR